MGEEILAIWFAGAMFYFFYALIEKKPMALILAWPFALAKAIWKAMKEI